MIGANDLFIVLIDFHFGYAYFLILIQHGDFHLYLRVLFNLSAGYLSAMESVTVFCLIMNDIHL